MNAPPVDIGAQIRTRQTKLGEIYVLVETDETGTKYQYVRIVKKNTIRVPRFVFLMDVLDRKKNKINQRQIILNADENVYVFHKLKSEAITQMFEKRDSRDTFNKVYELKTGQSATPGTGPADLIRGYAGLQPPKGIVPPQGGKTRRNKRSKRTRSRRNR
jgi:hypothetical protein